VITLGELCLLGALVASGYAAFACIVGEWRGHQAVSRSGACSAVAGVLALSGVTGVLAWALLVKDFRFAYVAEYSSRLLPWHYSLSALWVGQAGSLLLWAWFSGMLAIAYRYWPRREPSRLRQPAFGLLMAYLCFLVTVMVFGADPMQRSLGTPQDGAGLSPLLQHPAMLIHPPIVLLGYAGWAIPFALAIVGLAGGWIDASWIREARPWALFAWIVLGAGILWGAKWAYEELGWGGYWAWDPVENGSLIPWLAGTALIHTMMAWRYCGVLKKTALSLAVATLGLCDFAAFLTRSGTFSSLHAFSDSAVGWTFLGLAGVVMVGGVVLVVFRRKELVAQRAISGLWSREAWVLISAIALLLLAAVTLLGTLIGPASRIALGRGIVVGTAFYNNVLIPTGLVLLATTAAAPLLRWGKAPQPLGKRALFLSAGAAAVATSLLLAVGMRHPLGLVVAWLAVAAAVTPVAALLLDVRRADSRWHLKALWQALRDGRRQYAGYLIHLGFVCLAVGVTGSSLGTRRQEVVLSEGQTLEWAGRSIRCARLVERELPDKLVAEVQLEVSRRRPLPTMLRMVPGFAWCPSGARAAVTLLPAQHLHRLQNEWTTEVAIDSTWRGDFYAVFHGGEGEGRARLTLIENPMMRWIWWGGWIAGAGALLGLWHPSSGASRTSHRMARRPAPRQSVVPPPKRMPRRPRSQLTT
jgi:cytochrome c-type biogenesis protein CcmF